MRGRAAVGPVALAAFCDNGSVEVLSGRAGIPDRLPLSGSLGMTMPSLELMRSTGKK
jgi:hypothetical protein